MPSIKHLVSTVNSLGNHLNFQSMSPLQILAMEIKYLGKSKSYQYKLCAICIFPNALDRRKHTNELFK